MPEEPFVLMSLKEGKAKKMTQVLSNETARKILEYLSHTKEATESQVAKDLKLPMSTVHYNMRQLAENGLVLEDEFHYSEKGKEVIHYRIANKYIIIAPTDDAGILEKLKRFIPIIGIVTAASFIVALLQQATSAGAPMLNAMRAEKAAGDAMMLAASAPEAAPIAAQTPPLALYFLLGGLFALVIVLLWDFAKGRKGGA